MNVEQFEVFRTIVQVKSFTKAAKLLNFTQPAISAQIKILEKRYNIQLFRRGKNGVKLTEAGKKFYEYSEKILALYNEMEKDIANISGVSKEFINLGASYTTGNYYVPEIITSFKTVNPHAFVRLNVSHTNDIVGDIKNRSADMGIVEGNIAYDRDLDICKVGENELVLIVPVDEKWMDKEVVTIDELMKAPFISREEDSICRSHIHNCFKAHSVKYDDLDIIMEITNYEAIKHAVIDNKGISIVPYPVVERDLQQGNLLTKPLEDMQLFWDINVVSRADEPLSGAKEEFFNYITDSSRALFKGLQLQA